MITPQEVEMLAALVQRAGINPYEAIWANAILDRLRTIAQAQDKAQQKNKEQRPPGDG